MNEQERTEELIEKNVNFDNITEEIYFSGDFEQFKKEMLKILLTWRDFEKEKPRDNSFIIHFKKGSLIYPSDHPSYEDQPNYENYIPWFHKGKWIYREELLATLPEE